MNKTFLIFKHEFLQLLIKKGFIVMTMIIPILAVIALGIYQFVSLNMKNQEEKIIGYVDETGSFNQYTDMKNIKLKRFNTVQDATKALINENVKEYIVIPADYVSKGIVGRYTLKRQLVAPNDVTAAVKDFLTNNMLSGKLSSNAVERVKESLLFSTVTLTKTGAVAPRQGGLGDFLVPGIFSILLCFSMIFSSSYMLQGLGGEKENRVMEILLSSVSARQLLTGKVLGLGAAGLLQVTVWVISLPLILKMAPASIGSVIGLVKLPASFLALGITYFILGYMLFAILSAGIGAISSTTQEGQQLASIFTLLSASPLWFMSLLIAFPDNPVWVVLTIFPFTAPVLVMARLGVTDIPFWQIVVSIAVLVLCTVGGLLLASKAFRTYLLMYGKRPKLKEVIRSMKEN